MYEPSGKRFTIDVAVVVPSGSLTDPKYILKHGLSDNESVSGPAG